MAGLALKCRVCWKEKARNLLVLVTKLWAVGSPETIKDILLFCVPALSIHDNSYFCKACLRQLKFTYHFIKRCLKTENILVQKTTEIIQNLHLNGNKPNKLEQILEKSIENANKIQIIIEPSSEKVLTRNQDHTYFNSFTNKETEKSVTEQNPVISVSGNVAKPKKQNNLDEEDWFNDVATDDIVIDNDEGTANKKFKTESTVTKSDVPPQTIPEGLSDLLDFVPINVRCITVKKDMTPDHQKDLLQEGIAVVNMSSNPNKGKRVIYLGRDFYVGPLGCPSCKLSFNTSCDYADHRLLHRKRKISLPGRNLFSCDKCSKTFGSDSDFGIHYKLFHGDQDPFVCKRCSRKFKTCKELKNHEDIFKNTDKCVFKCARCNKEYNTKSQLAFHEANVADAPCCDFLKCKICSKNEHPNYICHVCGKSFHSSGSLCAHKKNVHKATLGMCHECGKIIKSSKMLRHHIDVVHGENKYMCDKCPTSFKSHLYLRKHWRNAHSGNRQKTVTCEFCGKAYFNKTGLANHIELIHSESTTFICPMCGEGFARKDYLNRHIAFHEKYGQYTCPVCKKSFSSEIRLISHEHLGHDENGRPLEQHSQSKPSSKKKYARSAPCVCNICHKVLASAVSLKFHYKAHLKIREYRCETCNVSLTYQAYKRHLIKHKDPKFDLSCNICHAYKSSQLELDAHMHMVHQNKKYQCKYCPLKFGRKHLLYSHENDAHHEEYAKRETLFQVLTSQAMVAAPENSWVSKTNKGLKLGPFDTDVDQVLDKLGHCLPMKLTDDRAASIHCDIKEDNFDILSEEYEMREEEVRACESLQNDMEFNS